MQTLALHVGAIGAGIRLAEHRLIVAPGRRHAPRFWDPLLGAGGCLLRVGLRLYLCVSGRMRSDERPVSVMWVQARLCFSLPSIHGSDLQSCTPLFSGSVPLPFNLGVDAFL